MHIVGNTKPTNYLSWCSIQDLRSAVDVRTTEELMVQRLRLGAGMSTDEDIQKKLDTVFQHGQPESSSEQNKGQAYSLHSFSSFKS